MPEFGSPFAGLTLDKKLSTQELARAVKFMIAAELEATQMYDQVAEATDDETAKKVISDISDEERVHVGEFSKLLETISPKDKELFSKGMDEAAELIGGKAAVSDLIRAKAQKMLDGGYEWQKGDWDPNIKTLKYVSPFTGKKFHVSPSASIKVSPQDHKELMSAIKNNLEVVQNFQESSKIAPDEISAYDVQKALKILNSCSNEIAKFLSGKLREKK